MSSSTFRYVLGLVGVVAVSSVVTWRVTRPAPTVPPPMEVLTAALPDSHDVVESAISPDGTKLVYVAVAEGRVRLFLRRFDRVAVTPIEGTDDATQPFFAPDGERVGFFAGGFLRWVALDGSIQKDVTPVSGTTAGATWGPADQIVFAPLGGRGLQLVSNASTDGTTSEITVLDDLDGEVSHGWPHFLHAGRSLVFTVGRTNRDPRLAWMSLESRERDMLAPVDGAAFYVDSAHIVYARRGEVFAIPVDAEERLVTGPSRVVTEGVRSTAAGYERLGRSSLVIARTGRMVFAEDTDIPTDNLMVWVDRRGLMNDVDGVAARHQTPRLAPDETRIAVTIRSDTFTRDLWAIDLAGGDRTQITHEAGDNHSPLWSTDGRRVTFASSRDGPQRIYRTTLGPSARVETLIFGDGRTPGSWSPDGQSLFFHESYPDRGRDIWVWSTARDGTANSLLLVATGANERAPAISPDGRWLAYVSDSTDGDQIYLQPYPNGRAERISRAGGTEPVWSGEGSELFFRRGRDLFAVTIDGDTGRFGTPDRLFAGTFVIDPGGNVPFYDVSADGTRFLMLRSVTRTSDLTVVSGWQSVVFPDP
jgi:Tol biopolymer transport system component